MNYLEENPHCYSPTFAALASLREIFRVSVAALPHWASAVNNPNTRHSSFVIFSHGATEAPSK